MPNFFADFINETETGSIGNFDVSKSFVFSTQLNGGFASAGMDINLPPFQASVFVRQVLGAHIDVFDYQGRTVYNGRVSGADASAVGAKIRCVGFWEDGTKITIPTALWLDPATTNGDVISDLIALVPSWNGGVDVGTMNVPVGAQDYNDEQKVTSMIDEMLKVGYRTDQIYASYIALYNKRGVHSIQENRPEHLNWLISTSNDTKVGSSVDLKDVYNRIFILYDDTAEDSVGPTLYPIPLEDLASQYQYGIREGVLNVGAFGLGIGLDLQGIALQKYARPRSNVPITTTGNVQRQDGSFSPAYMIRAGQWVGLINNDVNASIHSLNTGSQEGFVSSTSFSAKSNTTKIMLGSGDKKLDYLLARLGLSGGLS